MNKLIKQLQKDFPKLTFVVGTRACWSPKKQQISYKIDTAEKTITWGLLHELGHAILGHYSYTTDIGLLRKEVAAWVEAEALAHNYGFEIENNYIQSCLETYRNWLYKRSTCPQCSILGIQKNERQYYCINCETLWHISASRFCRPYRGYTNIATTKDTIKSQNNEYPWLFIANKTNA